MMPRQGTLLNSYLEQNRKHDISLGLNFVISYVQRKTSTNLFVEDWLDQVAV